MINPIRDGFAGDLLRRTKDLYDRINDESKIVIVAAREDLPVLAGDVSVDIIQEQVRWYGFPVVVLDGVSQDNDKPPFIHPAAIVTSAFSDFGCGALYVGDYVLVDICSLPDAPKKLLQVSSVDAFGYDTRVTAELRKTAPASFTVTGGLLVEQASQDDALDNFLNGFSIVSEEDVRREIKAIEKERRHQLKEEVKDDKDEQKVTENGVYVPPDAWDITVQIDSAWEALDAAFPTWRNPWRNQWEAVAGRYADIRPVYPDWTYRPYEQGDTGSWVTYATTTTGNRFISGAN